MKYHLCKHHSVQPTCLLMLPVLTVGSAMLTRTRLPKYKTCIEATHIQKADIKSSKDYVYQLHLYMLHVLNMLSMHNTFMHGTKYTAFTHDLPILNTYTL